MEYKEFKHKGIDYKLYLGNHVYSSYPIIKEAGGLKAIDMLILESGKADSRAEEFYNHRQYREIFENIPKENPELKIYDVDMGVPHMRFRNFINIKVPALAGALIVNSAINDEVYNRRDFIKKSAKYLAGLILLSPFVCNTIDGGSILFNDKETGFSTWYDKFTEKIHPSKVLGLRNAIIPEIIEKGIIPYEKIKNPKIGILYGYGHFGIEDVIKNQKSRNRILKIYKERIKKYSKELNQIYRILPLEKGNFKVEIININVF